MKKKLLLLPLLLLNVVLVFSQSATLQDTTPSFSSFYVRANPIGIAADIGKFSSKLVQNVEIGKSFGPLDVGINYGRFAIADSTQFMQVRTTFDASQIGIFSSEFALGAGNVFNSSTPLMFEVSTTLMAQISRNIGLGAIVGTYDFIGENNQFNKTFYGLFVRYGLLRSEGGLLLGKLGKRLGKHAKGRKAKSR